MHILFIGYGKTSQKLAKQLFQQSHQITTVSTSPKDDDFAQHLIQDVHHLDLAQLPPIDVVYILLAPQKQGDATLAQRYQQTYLDSAQPILKALQQHPVKRLIVVSSTRVYGENIGETIDDQTFAQPTDVQGKILLEMEQQYQQAYPFECIIIRPTGIYGSSNARMLTLAETTLSYPNIHWSNRIHIEDLVRFLAFILHVEHPEKTYICTNNQPQPLHEKILKCQRKMGLPELVLASERQTGKRIYATRMVASGFVCRQEEP